MKPKTAVPPGNMACTAEYEEISLSEAYETMGLMITESRLPEQSIKGRRDGVHIASREADHSCSDKVTECQKVRRYKEMITSLCRNSIPLCIEVLLCPQCELEPKLSNHNHDVTPGQSNSYVLLEQWTIQQVYKRIDNKAQSLQNLVQAVRSQLCFSQLSAWLHTSQGASPKHVFYRMTAPGEWFVHKFVMSPQSHTFPDAVLSQRGVCCRVTLSSLPRTMMTPFEISVANRDQLFAVKDASPLLRSSHNTFSSPGDSSGSLLTSRKHLEELCLTPIDRCHARSRSIRGGLSAVGGSLSDAHCSSDKHRMYGAQRRLVYNDQPSPDMIAAEHLASFSSLPTNLVHKLEVISCNSGTETRRPPNRLSLTSQSSVPLKSPKVLFTRTTTFSRDNFFPVVPLELDSSASLCQTDTDSDLEEDGAGLKAHVTGIPNADIMCKPFTANGTCCHSSDSTSTTESVTSLPSESVWDISSTSSHPPEIVDTYISYNTQDAFNSMVDVNYSQNGITPGQCQETQNNDHKNGVCSANSTPHVKHPPAFPQFVRSRLFKQTPSQSSPAPVKRFGQKSFEYDDTLTDTKSIKNALSCSNLCESEVVNSDVGASGDGHIPLSSSAPALTTLKSLAVRNNYPSHCLLGNFEESLLNGRIDPAGLVSGFTVDIGASGSFCPKHVTLPVVAYFFNSLSEDNAPSPYLGYVDLSPVSRRGYHVPRKGTLQITLFYPNHKVNKMFVVTYDLSDMPPKSQTFIRQKTVYAPCDTQSVQGNSRMPIYLRYLIHLRFRSTKSDKIYLHTDIRLIYARDKFEFDARIAPYELRSYIEAPSNPKYSPIR